MPTPRRGIAIGALIGGLGACLIKPSANRHDAGAGDGAVPDGTVSDADATPNVAFVTSGDYDLTTLTVSQLDAECTTLGGSGKFVAWYGTPGLSAVQRLGNAGGWVRKDGLPFAATADDIARGRMYYPLTVDDGGNLRMDQVYVATATLGDASANYAGTVQDCTQGASGGLFGVADGGARSWTAAGLETCTSRFHLYCLQIDHVATVAVAPQPGAHRVWLSQSTYMAGAGQSQLDSDCTTEGQARGIPSAHALVSNASLSALQKVTPGVVYARFDDVLAFDGQRRRIAPIDLTPGGEYFQGSAWAGSIDFAQAGSDADNCSAWTNASVNACAGDTSRSLDSAFGGLSCSFNCGANQLHLFCVQN